MRVELKEKLAALPSSPGVYLMKDAAGTVFYIGKAKSLRDRVRAYFSGTDARAFVALLDTTLADLEVVLTGSEKQALLVEDELIKRHQPRFNVLLKDDKRFLCLRLDPRARFPRLEVVRKIARDGARYFGPYTSASAVRETLRLVNRCFKLRTCSDRVLVTRKRPCLQHQIGRCLAPCVKELEAGVYEENVRNVERLLSGQGHKLCESLRAQMLEHARALRFEAAASLRDQARAVERSLERQIMVSADLASRDVLGFYREGPAVELHLMRIREGRLADVARYSLEHSEVPTSDLLADFAARYYTKLDDVPAEILFPEEMQWTSAIAELLTEKSGHRVSVITPARADKRRLVELAMANAAQAFCDKRRQQESAEETLMSLRDALALVRLPRTIECVDVSHLGGTNVVASLVRFQDGLPDKQGYRHYKIRSHEGQDDFRSIYEVICRRAARGLQDGTLPELLVIDGGKGQLNAARAALEDHGMSGVELAALAKAKVKSEVAGKSATARRRGAATVGGVPERVFVLGQKDPVSLRENSAELSLLIRLRDEAHRFAIEAQRRLRRKGATRSLLDEVSGIGLKRRRALLRTFGSITRLRQASEEELAKVVGTKTARVLSERLRQQ